MPVDRWIRLFITSYNNRNNLHPFTMAGSITGIADAYIQIHGWKKSVDKKFASQHAKEFFQSFLSLLPPLLRIVCFYLLICFTLKTLKGNQLHITCS